jgi:hypothetical protein
MACPAVTLLQVRLFAEDVSELINPRSVVEPNRIANSDLLISPGKSGGLMKME